MAGDRTLDPRAIGTSLGSLIAPCGDTLRPSVPPPPPADPPFGLTFSGGGFRATLAALGIVRFLADVGLLGQVRYVSSVSGGSVANAVDAVSGRSLRRHLVRNVWRVAGPKNRTDLLADALDQWWLGGIELERLDPEVRWIVNASNVTTGVRFAFERDVVGDYVTGLTSTAGSSIRLATAAAASAAVPGAFARVSLPSTLSFPCGDDRGRPSLLDGGVYDNTGLEALDGARYRAVFTISLNAGGVLQVGRGGSIPIVGDLMRSNELLYRQSTALRMRWMVDRFEQEAHARRTGTTPPSSARRGVVFALASSFAAGHDAFDAFTRRHPEHRTWQGEDLAFVPTVFDRLDRRLCRALVYRGWWLTGAALTRHHHDQLPLPELEVGPPLT